MSSKNERVELETKIMKYRLLARAAPDELTIARTKALVGRNTIKQAKLAQDR